MDVALRRPGIVDLTIVFSDKEMDPQHPGFQFTLAEA